ncbi:MAG: hypothetical protein ABI693_31820, partial [Bryobacteraceae bacterium]
MKPRSMLLLLAALAPAALGQIDAPRAGVMRDTGGEVRLISGVPGAFVLRPGNGLMATGGGYCGRLGLWQTADRTVLVDTDGLETDSRDAVTGPMALACAQGGASAVVWLAASGEMLGLPGWQEMAVPNWKGEPVALAFSGRKALHAVVRRGDGLWLVQSRNEDGMIVNERLLPGVQPPVALLADGTLIHFRDGSLVIEKARGESIQIPMEPVPVAF